MFPPSKIKLITCCCCCGAGGAGVAGIDGAPFTLRELAQLRFGARAFVDDTGRTCGDFFPTLLLEGSADRFIADRPTLLTKVKTLKALEELFDATTICVDIEPPPSPVVSVPVPPRGRRPQLFSARLIAPGTFLSSIPIGCEGLSSFAAAFGCAESAGFAFAGNVGQFPGNFRVVVL